MVPDVWDKKYLILLVNEQNDEGFDSLQAFQKSYNFKTHACFIIYESLLLIISW